MSTEVEVEAGCDLDVEILDVDQASITATIAYDVEVEVVHNYEVEAQVNEWQLVNDMIYVSQEFGEIPDWLETAINEIINDPNGLLVDSINELQNLFNQFEEGYESRVISLENSDESQNTQITSLLSKTDDNAAAVIRIDGTYATKSYAKAVSTEVVAAYLMDDSLGGAWFEGSVSAIADVAYSAARSASSLNASIKSNTDRLSEVYGTVDDLKKQIDGEIVTWFIRSTNPGDGTYFDPIGPILPSGLANPDGKPYYCWLPGNICPEEIYRDETDEDTRASHTGDTYVYYDVDAYGNKQIISTWRFGKNPNGNDYNWFIFKDDLASEAYQMALDAQDSADGKVSTYFQTWAPTLSDAGLVEGDAFKMNGDIWYNSTVVGQDDGGNDIYDGTMKRYKGKLANGDDNPTWHADNWVNVSDQRIEASVERLDEATVDVDGNAVAKGSLITTATGSSGETAVSGYEATASGDESGAQSKFRIFADDFEVASTSESLPVFYVDNSSHKVGFRAQVTFEGIPYFDNKFDFIDDTFSQHEVDIAAIENAGYITGVDVNENVTLIDGGVIKTGYVLAKYIKADYLSALSANLGVVNAGVMYNSGANSTNYTFMVNLNAGEIHIR